MIADNWDDLTSGTLKHAIDRTETGAPGATPFDDWTNVNSDGTTSGPFDCNDWGSPIPAPLFGGTGMANSATGSWTKGTQMACGQMLRLYCFQQP